MLYVSAHGAKSAKSVSPKVRKIDKNAAGNFFQLSHSDDFIAPSALATRENQS